MFGTDAKIHVDSQRKVWAGKRGDTELIEVPNPPETQARYRVEEQFTNTIRGKGIADMVAFETGVRCMEWTEAVYRSAMTGQAIYLPLWARTSTPQLPFGRHRRAGGSGAFSYKRARSLRSGQLLI